VARKRDSRRDRAFKLVKDSNIKLKISWVRIVD